MSNEQNVDDELTPEQFGQYEAALIKALDDFVSNIWRMPNAADRNAARARVQAHTHHGPNKHLYPKKNGHVTDEEDACYTCCLAKYDGKASAAGFGPCVDNCRNGSAPCPPGS